MATASSSSTTSSPAAAPSPQSVSPEFPQELVGKRVLLASESLGPVNGVSRTTQSLLDYLRENGVNVATCAPFYSGQPIDTNETRPERTPIVNKDWVRAIEAKSASLGSRALGGAWLWHHERDVQEIPAQQPMPQPSQQPKNPPMINRSRSEDSKKKLDAARLSRLNPEYRLQGYPLPYNPDLTVAYPFRLGAVYRKTFKPDLIYLASPASVGFQFLVELMQLDRPIPTLLNFQTDLAHYANILFPPPLDRYANFLLGVVQGYLFSARAVHTIFYPSAYVRTYMVDNGAPDDKMIHLGRGVDTELFHPARREDAYRKQIAPDGQTIFACISRIAPEKGFRFLAQVATALAESGLPFKLLIVGGNKNPVVENEVRGYFQHLPHHVIFTGMLRGTALARAYAAADVFLHCSISETFGLVVLESMASGVPVVARDEGGPSETVQHGRSGYLVPPHDLDRFVACARQLATNAPLRHDMAVHARHQAMDTTWDKINNKVALQLAKALRHTGGVTSEDAKERDGFYGTWNNLIRIYGAVGVIWVFWVIAVIPMLACGLVHGMYQRKRLS